MMPTKGDYEKVLFLGILVGIIIIVGFVWGTWRTGPSATQTNLTAGQQVPKSVLDSLTAANPHLSAPPASVLDSLTAANPHLSAPPASVLDSLTAK